jgi:hypothetical protein
MTSPVSSGPPTSRISKSTPHSRLPRTGSARPSSPSISTPVRRPVSSIAPASPSGCAIC